MSDHLYELLLPYLDTENSALSDSSIINDAVSSTYLSRLATLPLSSLTSSEAQSLTQTSQSILRSLQALSKRSHKSIISSADNLGSLCTALPELGVNVGQLEDGLPALERGAARFAEKYSKASDNPVLDRRKKAMLLTRNVDRVSDVLDLPALLSSAISSSTVPSGASGNASAYSASYASALDLHAHVKRLNALYPSLNLVKNIGLQAESGMKTMTATLILSMQAQGIKLAAAMRTIGWLRRVAPELDGQIYHQHMAVLGTSEGTLGAVFLVCRLSNLLSMLDALEPLRELADQESKKRKCEKTSAIKTSTSSWSGGQQTERYLKRYIEIFREQSFAIISMYKSIFPSALPAPGTAHETDTSAGLPSDSIYLSGSVKRDGLGQRGQFQPVPSALATFPSHIVELLVDALREYLPNVLDKASRDSLLTQVLYCANSLGRLGGDFSMMLALLEEAGSEDTVEANDEDEEWADAMKKHRIQASRLELLASGVGTSRNPSLPIRDQTSTAVS